MGPEPSLDYLDILHRGETRYHREAGTTEPEPRISNHEFRIVGPQRTQRLLLTEHNFNGIYRYIKYLRKTCFRMAMIAE